MHQENDIEVPWTQAETIAQENLLPVHDADLANPQEAIFGPPAEEANELSRRLMLWSDTTAIQARLAKGQRLDDVLQADLGVGVRDGRRVRRRMLDLS